MKLPLDIKKSIVKEKEKKHKTNKRKNYLFLMLRVKKNPVEDKREQHHHYNTRPRWYFYINKIRALYSIFYHIIQWLFDEWMGHNSEDIYICWFVCIYFWFFAAFMVGVEKCNDNDNE